MRRVLPLAVVLTLAMPAFALAETGHQHHGSAPAPEAQEAKKSSEIVVSLGSFNAANNVNWFQMTPGIVYVKAGESVTFVNNHFDPHTVTFLAGKDPMSLTEEEMMSPAGGTDFNGGFLNSGFIAPGTTFKLTFSKAGMYEYVCLPHPWMSGKVVVLPADAPAPSLEERAAMAEEQSKAELDVEPLVAHKEHTPAKQTRNADGTTTFTVELGFGKGEFLDIGRFFPGSLQVAEGDTVKFALGEVGVPYIVGINFPKDLQIFGPQGPNPEAMAPMGGNTFNGTGTVSSGLLMPAWMAPPDMPVVSEWSLTFTKAGTYTVSDAVRAMFGNAPSLQVTVVKRSEIKATVNGKQLETGYLGAHVYEGQVYLPLRATADLLGADVTYDAQLDAAFVTQGAQKAAPAKVSAKAYLNGEALETRLHESRLYVPATSFAAILGGQVEYDAASGKLTLTIAK